MISSVDAYILAGGKSERMKTNKATLPWRNRTIIEHLYAGLKKVFEEVFVVVKDRTIYEHNNFNIVLDNGTDYCPIIGIFTALSHTKKSHVFIKACDNPLFSEKLVYYMFNKIKDYDIVVPRTADGYHPLFGYYSRRCLNIFKDMIDRCDYRIINVYGQVSTLFIGDEEIKLIDKKMITLKNLNTPQDFCQFRKIFEGETNEI